MRPSTGDQEVRRTLFLRACNKPRRRDASLCAGLVAPPELCDSTSPSDGQVNTSRTHGSISIDLADHGLVAGLSRRKAQVIELRFFGGLSVEETAETLQVSADTVMRN